MQTPDPPQNRGAQPWPEGQEEEEKEGGVEGRGGGKREGGEENGEDYSTSSVTAPLFKSPRPQGHLDRVPYPEVLNSKPHLLLWKKLFFRHLLTSL